MGSRSLFRWVIGAVALVATAGVGWLMRPAAPAVPEFDLARQRSQQLGLGRGGGNRGAGRGGFGGGPDVALLAQFDQNENGRLEADERVAAREEAEARGLDRSGFGRRRGGFENAPRAGRTIMPSAVRPYPTTPFYDGATLRTLFLTFENDAWERELMAFKRTDVDVPASLTVDGRTYRDVGVQFHGNSSFNGVPLGFKHSMRIAVDFVHDKQDVQGYRTLLLLNAHEDASFVRSVLALDVARDYIPAPRANLVRVVINGESWGIFVNQQQFNKDLTREWFQTGEGVRWKVSGNAGRNSGGLSYLGDDPSAYTRVYEIKSKDDPKSWEALIETTRLLATSAPDDLVTALTPHLDIDGALKFLAVDNALANSDGYWTRASDYSLFMEPNGRFHLLPYDVNSTFSIGGGRGGGRGGSVDLDPLQAVLDPAKAVAHGLLAVPALRTKYLGVVRDVATKWLDWRRLAPVVARYHALIDADVRADTRKLYSYDAFRDSVADLEYFAERRRSVLLEHTANE